MVRYETLILATPEITDNESANLESQFDQFIKKNKGIIRSFERWGKYKLAYPVKKNEYGVYFLIRFEISLDNLKEIMKEIEMLFKLNFNQIVMRFMNTKLNIEGSLEYLRPDSLEELPAQDVDKFLRENNMGGWIKNSPSSNATKEEVHVKQEDENYKDINESTQSEEEVTND